MLTLPVAASDQQSAWTEDPPSSVFPVHGRQNVPLKTLEEADYKQAFIYGAEAEFLDALRGLVRSWRTANT
ncbi:MAG: hypothetical protein H2057_04045 [Alphaproteobacteria bacterium]|nr:hypothetical protein [Alphaproteobacteria bacterium]